MIEQEKLEEIIPYKKNAKKHPSKQIKQVANSIREFGFNQPIVIDENKEIIVGHGRYYAAKSLGMEEVPAIKLTNLSDAQKKAYRLADNKLNESDWDMELVVEELRELDNEDFNIELTGFDKSDLTEDEINSKYSEKVVPPVYEPSEDKPEIKDLYDKSKTEEIVKEIKDADISEQEKEFLIDAASRLTVFYYKRIADYYAQADKRTQELMEKMALVIIDFDKAIEEGYVEACDELLSVINPEEGYDE